MATFTKKNWVTGETITDTKLNNEKGYYLLETDLNDFELQVGDLTEDDLLNIIICNGNYYNTVTYWTYTNMIENKYTNYMILNGIEYYPSTGILKTALSDGGPIG